jgi:hypothetical protein
MIYDADRLTELVDSGPVEGAYLTDHQAYLLDRAIIWSVVEENYPRLWPGLLADIHDRTTPMTMEVLEILWELNGSAPVTEGGEDIWL